MEINLDLQKLRQNKLFVTTPCYGGVVTSMYAKSMMDLVSVAMQYGIKYEYFSLSNESLIARARNYCAAQFLDGDSTHLLFVDADIEFSAQDVLVLLHFAEENSDKDIICGAYPKKSISWEKVKLAVDKAFADENPNILENFVGDMVFNPISSGSFKIDEPLEVAESGTGFMMIKRKVFETMLEKNPDILYTPDHVRTPGFDGSRKIGAFFQDPIDKETNRHLSEDYFFCREARKLGFKVWVCPWMNLSHVGTYIFRGNIAALAAVSASVTVDQETLKKTK